MSTGQADEISEDVARFIREELLIRRPGPEPDRDTDLIDTGVVDSVGLFRLVAHLEGSYDLVIPPEDIVPGNLGSIDRISNYVAAHRERA
jgi:acyl carrier protein